MSFTYLRQRDQLSLSSVQHFLKPLDKLQFFVRNVPLQLPVYQRVHVFSQISKFVLKSFNQNNIKVLQLWKQFVERLNDAYMGVTSVHVALLSLAMNQHQFKLALSIVQTPGLPQSITMSTYLQYLIFSSYVYNQFDMYSKSYESLDLGNSLDAYDLEMSFFTLKSLVLVSNIVGCKFQRKDFIRQFDRIKHTCQKDLIQWTGHKPEKYALMEYEFQLFQAICDNKELSDRQIQYLKGKSLFGLYEKGCNNKFHELRRYIKNDLREQNYRIKCNEVKDQPINKFQIIRDLNKFKKIYKYDSKNKIMYFEHHQSSPAELDDMINQACEMRRIIKNRPVQKRNLNLEKGEENSSGSFGGFGGFGGSSGFRGSLGTGFGGGDSGGLGNLRNILGFQRR